MAWKKETLRHKKNTDALVVASKKSWLEANADKTKYTGMPRDQKAGRRHIWTIENGPFERVE